MVSHPTVPQAAELVAPATWATVDFIADLHLQAEEPATFAAWQRYLGETPADAVVMLGDLFEVWVGDDALRPGSFEAACADVMRQASGRLALFFMHGNRDFLVGDDLMARTGATLLDDPTVLVHGGRRWLLSHGDALCLDDVDYLAFRGQVRAGDWQRTFLSKPLAERQAIARGIRQQSDARKRSGQTYADVDGDAARGWLDAAGAAELIHGHTHRPARHALSATQGRTVLSDWDLAARPPRAEVLRLNAGGLHRISLA